MLQGVYVLDFLLASMLLIGMPVYAILRGLSTRHPPVDKLRRYRRSIASISILLMILLVDWVITARGLTQLGLAAPTSHAAIGGFVVAVLVAIVLFFYLASITKSNVEKATRPDDQAHNILPESRDELRLFVVFTIMAGFGWEVLYRGFLLFWLSPMIGLAPAVAASSTAYGLCHGYKTMTQTVGSLVSSLLFTTGYATTGNLWWLIILHIALPLLSVLATSRTERTVASHTAG